MVYNVLKIKKAQHCGFNNLVVKICVLSVFAVFLSYDLTSIITKTTSLLSRRNLIGFCFELNTYGLSIKSLKESNRCLDESIYSFRIRANGFNALQLIFWRKKFCFFPIFAFFVVIGVVTCFIFSLSHNKE